MKAGSLGDALAAWYLVLFSGIIGIGWLVITALYSASTVTKVVTVINPPSTQELLEIRYQIPYPTSYVLAATIEEASKKEGIPVSLIIAQIKIESEFKPHARGSKGEYGYLQVRGIWDEICPYNRLDQYGNIFQGACALKHSILQGGDIAQGLIIYNIGITNYNKQKAIASGKVYRDKVLNEQAQL
jgi:hypothetical protein